MINISVPRGVRRFGGAMIICATVLLPGCRKATPPPPPPPVVEKPKPPPAVPTWLGNPERNFYGTGPWKDGELKIVWEVQTGSISGRFHPDPWGGTSWPGQPSVEGDFVYFPSADGNTYCLNRADGSVVIGRNTVRDPAELKELTVQVAAAWLACGLDPQRVIFYRQSDVPETFELTTILMAFAAKGLMNRAHAYKAKVAENVAAEHFVRFLIDDQLHHHLFVAARHGVAQRTERRFVDIDRMT